MDGHFDTKVDRRTLLGILATAAFGQPSLAQAQTTERAGMVTEVKGDAFAEARNQRRTLAQSATLFIKDMVGTGSDARLTMRLRAKTRLASGPTSPTDD